MVLAVFSYKYLKNKHSKGHRKLIFKMEAKIIACKENSNTQGPKKRAQYMYTCSIKKIYIPSTITTVQKVT